MLRQRQTMLILPFLFFDQVVSYLFVKYGQYLSNLPSVDLCWSSVFLLFWTGQFWTVASIRSVRPALWHGCRRQKPVPFVNGLLESLLRISFLLHNIPSISRMGHFSTRTFVPSEKQCCFFSFLFLRYTLELIPVPDYEGQVSPSTAKKNKDLLKNWIEREVEVLPFRIC